MTKDALNKLTAEELLAWLSLKEETSTVSYSATHNKNVESKIGLCTPFFKEQMEEKNSYTPLSPKKCKSFMSLNQQRYNSNSVNPKKLDFIIVSINKKNANE